LALAVFIAVDVVGGFEVEFFKCGDIFNEDE
jgi:hypothetical protein